MRSDPRHRNRMLHAAALLATACSAREAPAPAATPPPTLAETGLYSDLAARSLAPGVLGYTPVYPLWSDGATKRRFIRLPPGAAIDARDPDAWVFPVGTRVWKEFAFGGRPVETRYLERTPAGWLYATYAWSEDGREATLAPERGVRGVCEIVPGVRHDLPAVADCRACHEGGPVPVLGVSALQLSPDRDPLAPHAEWPAPGDVDLRSLVARGLVRNLPPALATTPPRIVAATPRARAALGYLHANCASCHDARGPLGTTLGLDLAQRVAAPASPGAPLPTASGVPSRFRPPGLAGPEGVPLRIAPGDPAGSVLLRRLAAKDPTTRMPPLGRHLPDAAALELLAGFVRLDLAPARPDTPSPEAKQ